MLNTDAIDATEGIALGSALVILDEQQWQRQREEAQRRVEPEGMGVVERAAWWLRMTRGGACDL